jgi:hypothetical protein
MQVSKAKQPKEHVDKDDCAVRAAAVAGQLQQRSAGCIGDVQQLLQRVTAASALYSFIHSCMGKQQLLHSPQLPNCTTAIVGGRKRIELYCCSRLLLCR